MASCRIARLMASPSLAALAALPPKRWRFRASGRRCPGTSLCDIRQGCGKRGILWMAAKTLRHLHPLRSAPAWRPARRPPHDDLLPGSETVLLQQRGRAVDGLWGRHRLRRWLRQVYSAHVHGSACCTSPSATGLVLRAEVSDYVDRKTLHFVK